MRLANTTPFLAGYKVTSRRPPRPEVSVVVRATFVLAPGEPLRVPEGLHPMSQGNLGSEVFREDDEDRTGACQYPGDFADYKLRAEVMLKGACHVPGGRAVKECPVRFSVGKWSKSLLVVGPRAWAGDAMSEPLPFTRMPVGYENAFGGPGHAPNPAGKGIGTRELPNVELPGERVRSRSDRPAPAGFGPVNPSWPERAAKLGRAYGEAWRKERAPFFAQDLDWSYFSAAPADQQLEGYLRGDEEVTFQNLHEAAPIVTVRLPSRRIRVFVLDARGSFREAKVSLDTLFADLDLGRLYLTWRGVEAVEEEDLADVRGVLVADEPLGGPAEAEGAYRTRLEKVLRDPAGLDDAVPAHLREAWEIMRGKAPPPEVEGADPVSALLAKSLGGSAAAEQTKIAGALAAMLAAPMPEGVDARAALARAVNDRPRSAPVTPPSVVAPPRVPVGDALSRAIASAGVLRKDPATSAAVPGLGPLEALAHDPRLRQLDPGLRAPGEAAPPPPAPGPGVDLSGQDLSGRDLRGVDLRAANLTDAILTGAQLGRAQLAGANLLRAVLAGAELSDADLSGADLTLASLAKARAPGANFSRAKLDKLNAPGAVLADADFTGASGELAVFEGADLGRTVARGLVLDQCVFDGASLERADFTGATLTRCRFLAARAAGARFERARLDGACFTDADLTEAVLTEAQGLATVWLRATLARADLRWASLPEAIFLEIKAAGVRMRFADLRDGRFYRADLTRADLAQSNLLRADLCRTVLTGATFAGASLFDAKLLGAAGEGCDFSGANLRRAVPERR